MKYASTRTILALIILFALVLRLPALNSSFTGDEIDTVGPARSFVVSGDFRSYDTATGPYYNFTHPPVRMLLYSYWAALAGFSNAALRLIPLLLGTAFIFLVFFLGKTLYSEKIGLIAAALAAVSRYSIWFSDTVSVDTGHFLFTTCAAVLFFTLYMKNDKKSYLAASLIFASISMLTKFSAIIIFIPIITTAVFYKKKKAGAFFIAAILIVSIISMFAVSLAFSNPQLFYHPIKAFIEYSGSSSSSLNDYIFNKLFKAATITWQMTPFFAVLLLVSLYRLKRTREFWILSSWLIIGFLIVMYPYGQDAQRYFGVALAPAFIIIAKYLESLNFKSKILPITTVSVILLAAILGLNDLMGYYDPFYIGIFYLIALLPLIYKKRTYILVGGFIGLSMFFAFTHASNLFIVSDAVHDISNKVLEYNYPYKEVWSSKDITYYIAPPNETVHINLVYDISFFTKETLRKNNVKYLAFYSTPDEAKIKAAAELCANPYLYGSYGHTIGFVCELNQSKIE